MSLRKHSSLLLISVISLAIQAHKLTPERIFSSPSLDGEQLKSAKIAPDGSRVTFLKGKQDDYERLDLWEYSLLDNTQRLLFDSNELHMGDEQLSDEEKARRERQRLSGTGIVSYQWSNDGKALLFPLAGDVYYWKIGQAKAKKLLDTPEFETDIQFSPKGNYIAYIRNQNLFIKNIATEKETQLSKSNDPHIKYGMAEFIAQEEMGRMTGYWWSPDETKIAVIRVDESPVELVTRSEIYAEEITTVTQRYPFAGKANVKVELGVVDVNKLSVDWIDLGKNTDTYLPRVQWTESSAQLTYQWQSRDQKQLELRLYDLEQKKQQLLIKETSNTWINLHDELRFFKDGKRFIWASEKTGFKHLYLHHLNSAEVSPITSGDWVIEKIKYLDEKNNRVYFTGRKDSVLESHLYWATLDGKAIQRVTDLESYHDITFSKDGSLYIDNFSSASRPYQSRLHNKSGEMITWLLENKIDKEHPMYLYTSELIKPEFGSFETEDKTRLHYRLFKPSKFNPKKKYPVIVYLYGGPHAQMVTNRWSGFTLQYLAQQGYVVFTLDNRGSNYRGKAFEDPIYRAMGDVEVRDQVAGVKFLHQFPWIDKNKIGVHGHSYGGYMTLMALFKAGEYFKAGVAGAPVTDWTLYDTHYTERYMGHPEKDKQAYEKSSVFPYATELKSPLLIYHGMADDNVLFKNSTKLYKLLQDNAIQFYVMDYPGKKHSIRGKTTQMHRLMMIRNFFDLHFGVKRK